MRSDAERLRDILDAINQIRKYSSAGREAFEQDELIQVWIAHHLARLGEAAARLSPEPSQTPVRALEADYRSAKHSGARVFPYRSGDALERIDIHLPPLETQVRTILAELEGRD